MPDPFDHVFVQHYDCPKGKIKDEDAEVWPDFSFSEDTRVLVREDDEALAEEGLIQVMECDSCGARIQLKLAP